MSRFERQVGHLHVSIAGNGGYKTPEHPDYEPEMFNWYVAPDDEDKNYRRAVADGCAPSHEQALVEVRRALQVIMAKLSRDLEAL